MSNENDPGPQKKGTSMWANAERQIAQYFAEKLGLEFEESLIVGTLEDLLGRFDTMAFCIEGGDEQSHGYQDGCRAWLTRGMLCGVNKNRQVLQMLFDIARSKDNCPFEKDGKMPNVSKVFPRTHPVIKKEKRRIANAGNMAYVSVGSMEFGVVYDETA